MISDLLTLYSFQIEVLQLRRQIQEERLARHKAEQRVVEVSTVKHLQGRSQILYHVEAHQQRRIKRYLTWLLFL